MSENKTGKYLKYAIGEIVLVMIGILLAIQVNNLNEFRKDRITEQSILIQLKKEFEANLVQLDTKITQRNIIIEAGIKVLEYFDNPNSESEESLIKNISHLAIAPTFNPINNDLINSGKIDLIQHQELKQLLTEWPTYVLQLNEIENENSVNYKSIFVPLLMEIGISREVDNVWWESDNNFIFLLDKMKYKPQIIRTNQEVNFQEIQDNKILEGIVSNSVILNNIGNIESKSIRKRILQILELLKQEIK